MVGAKRAHTAETLKRPSHDLRSRAPYFYPDQALIRHQMRGQWPEFSVNDLKAWFRGRKYVVETLKRLPEIPDAILIDEVIAQVTELGRVNHVPVPA